MNHKGILSSNAPIMQVLLLLLSRISRVRPCATPQSTRLLCPWDSPGRNTGVGCHFLLKCMHACMLSRFSHVRLCATLQTAAHQAPLSLGFSRQEYWSGLPFPSPIMQQSLKKKLQEHIVHNQSRKFQKNFFYLPFQIPKWQKQGNGGHLTALPRPQRRHICYAKSLQSCPTLCNPIDSSPPGSPVPGILQARTLEWVAISFSNA